MRVEQAREPDDTSTARVEAIPDEIRESADCDQAHGPPALSREFASKFGKARQTLGQPREVFVKVIDARPLFGFGEILELSTRI